MRLLIASLLLCVSLAAQTNFRIQLSGNGPPTGSCNAARYTDEDSGLSYLCTDTTHLWVLSPTVPWRLQPGLMIMIISGTCPAGFTEVTALNGKTLVGTLAANLDVGTTGGLDNIIPTGTVAAPVFTGNSVVSSAVSAGTPAGSNGTAAFTPAGTIAWPAGAPTNTAITAGTPAGTISALTTGADSSTTGGVAKAIAQTPTFTGSALATHTHTVSWPAGVPVLTGSAGTVPAEVFTGSPLSTHTHTITATGTNSAPTFTGTQFDNRSAFVRVIFCSKN